MGDHVDNDDLDSMFYSQYTFFFLGDCSGFAWIMRERKKKPEKSVLFFTVLIAWFVKKYEKNI